MTEKNYGFRFQDWDIYKDSRKFRLEINTKLKKYPAEEKYVLVDQTKRALNSVMLAIAEGANKNSDKETRVYINRALTSLDEVIACLDCALDDKYIHENEYHNGLEQASSLAKRLRGFDSHLSSFQQRSSSTVKDHSRSYGFSLLEMVIVIFLLGVMMTLTLTNYRSGETQKRVAIAADIVTNTIRNAQNYTLTGKQTTNANPNCRVPANFYVTFEYANSSQASVRATNNCGGDDLIETFTFPANTRIQPNSLMIWNTFGNASTAVSSLNFVFHTPYANMEAKKDTDPYAKFNSAQITVESNNGEYAKVVPVDGISGRIGN